MSLLRRREMMGKLAESELFTYVGTYTFTNTYGRVSIGFDADDDSVYFLVPQNAEIINNIFIIVSIRNGKYGFSYCNENNTNGLTSENNYTLSDGEVSFAISTTNSNIYNVEYDLFKMSQI